MLIPGAFGDSLRPLLTGESGATARRVAKRSNIYGGGSRDDKIYFITTGQVKMSMQSPGGKECMLAIYTAGDFFGESCLTGGPRVETAIAMTETVLKQMQGARFLALIASAGLVRDFVGYLAQRLTEQQQMITNLATVDCECRLGEALLRLSRKLGSGNVRGLGQKISHQELSQMVGTTRPRISEFMHRFRDLGLIDMTPDSHILIREGHLQEYLETRGLDIRLSAVAS